MQNSFRQTILVLGFHIVALSYFAQKEVNYPLNYFSHLYLEDAYSLDSTQLTPSFQVVPESWLQLDSVWPYRDDETYYSWINERLYYEHLFTINKGELNVNIDLLGSQELGWELGDTSEYSDTTNFYFNSRGFLIRGGIGEKFSFETSFLENQIYVPTYLQSFVDSRETYPGGGRIKRLNNGGFDYAQSGGYISYSPNANLNFQFGHGKSFIGQGHRSMLLSDNTNNYPYLRANVRAMDNKLSYHTTFAQLLNLDRLPKGDTPEPRYEIKNAQFHFLQYSPLPQLSLGLYQGVVWRRYDTEDGTLPINIGSVIPIIGVGGLLESDETMANSIWGLDLAYKITPQVKAYGQLVMDNGKGGFQIGARSSNLLMDNLYLLAEYNRADAYTYSSKGGQIAYGHFTQELAHPLGAGFDEIVTRATYFMNKRVYGDVQLNFYTQAMDVTDSIGPTNVGSFIFYDNELDRVTDANEEHSVLFGSLTVGYLFNPKSNLNGYLRFVYRSDDSGLVHDNAFIRLGIKTSIFNHYDDF